MTETNDAGGIAPVNYDRRPVPERTMEGLNRRKSLLLQGALDRLEASFGDEVLSVDICVFDSATGFPLACSRGELDELAKKYKASLMCQLARTGDMETTKTLLVAPWWHMLPKEWPVDAMAMGACAEGQVAFLRKFGKNWTYRASHLYASARAGHAACLNWLLDSREFTPEAMQKAMEGAALAGYADCVNLLMAYKGTGATPALLAAVESLRDDTHLRLGGRPRDWEAVLFYLQPPGSQAI